jgi:undecaprenyl-diphosphatase
VTGHRGAAVGAGLGAAVLATSTAMASSGRVPEVERQAFRSLNGLPPELHRPVHVVMQGGSLGFVLGSAALARLVGRRRLAAAIAVAGTGVWAGAKVLKRRVGRGRPVTELDAVVVRGRDEGDLGFPSGHAAVAFCLAALVAPELPRPLAWLPWTAAAAVGGARVYVGAHLPLDVVGGAAFGVVVGETVRLAGLGPGGGSS